MKVPHWIRKEKNAEVAKINGKNESSVCEIAKQETEIYASFAVAPHAAKVKATVHGKCSVKVEKALSLYSKIIWDIKRDHIHITFIIM